MNEAEKQVHDRASREDYSPIAARTNLQPATTPIGAQNTSSYQQQQQQRAQPQYVSVSNAYNQMNQLAGGNMREAQVTNSSSGRGAFTSVLNSNNNNTNSVQRRTDSPSQQRGVTTPAGGSSSIRPGALFGGR